MKRVALLTIFFYCCTFTQPPQSQSAVPVALLAAAAIGATMAASSGGTYYAQTGQVPEYVKTASNAVASAADAVFQPSYLAQAVGLLFTPQSLNTAKEYYVGKAAAVGVKISDLLDTVASSAESAYSSLKEVIDSCMIHNLASSEYPLLGGDVIETPVGILKLRSDSSGRWFTVLTKPWDQVAAYADYFGSYGGVSYSVHIISGIYNICKVEPSGTPGWYTVSRWPCTVVSIPVTNPLTPNDVNDFPALAAQLQNPSAAVANDVQDAIKNTDHDKKIFADNVPSTTTSPTTAQTLTPSEIAQVLKDNAAAVAQAAAEAAQAVAAANPTDAAAQIAALQAATNAARVAAEAAESAANEPTPNEPEPNYPVPSTWYTKTCDLSNGLKSCIDYQQVLNATESLKSTIAYQAPSFVLDCLDYVKGSGCQNPPSLSIDFFTRFTSSPLKIDLTPFQSVVSTLKFFFSLLCFIMTYKSVMHLFR